jgi:hypothetical protein
MGGVARVTFFICRNTEKTLMGLPSKILKFTDLKRVNINNWPSLKRRVQQDGFPAGRYIGSNRIWTEEEVEAWWNSRPKAKSEDPPENVVKPAPCVTRGTGQTANKNKHPGYNEPSLANQVMPNGGASD